MRLIVLFIFSILIASFNYIYSQTAEEQEMFDLVNTLRQERGLQPVQLNTALNQAAYDHSLDMAVNDYFSHTGLNGSSFSQRAANAGYTGSPRGENIAAGNSEVEATFNQWKNSTGHLNNMLNSNINEMGIGHAYDGSSTYRHYWTQIFGKGDATLSDDDVVNTNEIAIYPNPVRSKLAVELSKASDVSVNFKLVSLTGQVIYSKSKNLINNAFTVDIQHINPGIYFLHINNAKKGHKIIKL